MPSASVFTPEAQNENFSFSSALQQSYNQAKKHLHDGMAVIKDEFIGMYDRAGSYFNLIASPVNNFLKDLTQIEEEFLQNCESEPMQMKVAVHNCNIIPIDQALKGCMEENY